MKRQKSILRPTAVLAAVLVALNLLGVNTIIHTATYDYTKMTTGTDTLGGVTYLTVNYEGLYNYGEPGMPSLPVDYIDFSVPWNATNFSVTATLSGILITNNNYLVYPCQELRTMCDTTPVTITPPNLAAYANYPQQNAWVVDEGFLAGENHIVTIAVMPVSYVYFKTGRITTNQLKKAQQVRLTLRYDLSDSLALYPIVRNDSALRAEGYRLTKSMVVNPANVEAYAPTDMTLDPMDVIFPDSGDGLNGGGVPGGEMDPPAVNDSTTNEYGGELSIERYPYLIVTTPELQHSVRRIAALKRQKGYNVKVVTMEDVLNDPYANQGDLIKQPDGTYLAVDTTSTGKLRQYLKKCFCKYGTEYVLLAGTDIPYKSILYPGKSFTYISDFYYSDLSANWDVEDWGEHVLDRFTELYVGRILSKTSNQIDNYSEKLFRYELNPGDGDRSYLKKALFSEGREFRNCLYYVKKYLGNIYTNKIEINDFKGNDSLNPSARDIIDTLKAVKVGFASIFNHGDTTRIRVYGKDNNGQYSFIHSLSNQSEGDGLNCLANKKYPMICYSPNCVTIPFDNYDGINVGESFTTGKDYGGPVYIGNTREAVSVLSEGTFERFADNLSRGAGEYKLGKIDALSKEGTRRYMNEIMIHAYLGDPSLEIWTDEPQGYSNISVSRTDNSITVSGVDVNSTIIACYNNNGEIMSDTISTNSVTFSSVSPNSTIVLYKHNCIPYIAPMALQNFTISKNQYVIASDVTAGNSVDNDRRTGGEVIVKGGVEYEIEASGTVTLQDGFKVEKGATFAVYRSCF